MTDDFLWVVDEAAKKKKRDFSKVEFLTVSEGVFVQCMHIGSYDEDPVIVAMMHNTWNSRGMNWISRTKDCTLNLSKRCLRGFS